MRLRVRHARRGRAAVCGRGRPAVRRAHLRRRLSRHARFRAADPRAPRRPATVFLAPGLIERSARLWWLELEEAIRRLDAVEVARAAAAGGCRRATRRKSRRRSSGSTGRCGAPRSRTARRRRRNWPPAPASPAPRSPTRCSWTGTKRRAFAAHPLVERRRASVTHRRLAQWPAAIRARRDGGFARPRSRRGSGGPSQLRLSRRRPTSAGAREFALARELGFTSR